MLVVLNRLPFLIFKNMWIEQSEETGKQSLQRKEIKEEGLDSEKDETTSFIKNYT